MRKQLKRYIPDHDAVRSNRWLAPFGSTLLHPRLWHLNRHSAAGGVAVGLFCGLIPGPFQMLSAAVFAVAFKVNLPLALVTTLYSNPLTIVPLYYAAYLLGRIFIDDGGQFVAPPEFAWNNIGPWIDASLDWMLGLGKPLALGLPILAVLLAAAGYLGIRATWRFHLVRAWQHRKGRRP